MQHKHRSSQYGLMLFVSMFLLLPCFISIAHAQESTSISGQTTEFISGELEITSRTSDIDIYNFDQTTKQVRETIDESNFQNVNEKLREVAKRRFAILKNIAKQNPQKVFELTLFTAEERNQLPQNILPFIEEVKTFNGELEGSVYDYADELPYSRTEYQLITAEKVSYTLAFTDKKILQALPLGKTVTVPGVALGNILIINEIPSISPQVMPDKKTVTPLGQKKFLLIRFYFSADGAPPSSPSDLQVLGQLQRLHKYFNASSYNQLDLKGLNQEIPDFTPWVEICAKDCDFKGDWTTKATKAAKALGKPEFDPDNHDYVGYLFVPGKGKYDCKWGGTSGVGLMPGKISWYNGINSAELYAHELGHNFGLHHANARDCGLRSTDTSANCYDNINPFTDPNNPLISEGLEYWDMNDVMGDLFLNRLNHLDAPHKQALGWFSPMVNWTPGTKGPSYGIGVATGKGNYTISRIEDKRPFPNDIPFALKIDKPFPPYKEPLYVEYRQPILYDTDVGKNTEGVLIHAWNGTTDHRTYLLDSTPTPGDPSVSDFEDARLGLNSNFCENQQEVKLKVIDLNPDTATIELDYGPCADPPSSCPASNVCDVCKITTTPCAPLATETKIKLMNIKTETPLDSPGIPDISPYAIDPSIEWNAIVWAQGSSSFTDAIMRYDSGTKKITKISESDKYMRRHPITANHVVWEESNNATDYRDIVLWYNNGGGQLVKFSPPADPKIIIYRYMPRLVSTYLVWLEIVHNPYEKIPIKRTKRLIRFIDLKYIDLSTIPGTFKMDKIITINNPFDPNERGPGGGNYMPVEIEAGMAGNDLWITWTDSNTRIPATDPLFGVSRIYVYTGFIAQKPAINEVSPKPSPLIFQQHPDTQFSRIVWTEGTNPDDAQVMFKSSGAPWPVPDAHGRYPKLSDLWILWEQPAQNALCESNPSLRVHKLLVGTTATLVDLRRADNKKSSWGYTAGYDMSNNPGGHVVVYSSPKVSVDPEKPEIFLSSIYQACG